MKQTVLSREVLDSLPNRIDVWAVARVIPSVILSKVDVGGSESFLQSTATVHGSNNENGFLIDGMDVSEPRRQRHRGRHVSRSVRLRGNQLPDGRRRHRGVAEGRAALQHDHPDRAPTSSTAARCSTARITAWVRRTTPTNCGAVAGRRSASGARGQPEHRAWRRHPEDLRRRAPGWPDRSCATSCGSRSRAHDQALDQYLLGNYNPDGTQVLDDNLMWTTAAKVAWQVTRERPALVLQQPAVQADRPPQRRRHVCREPREEPQRQVSRTCTR